MKTISPTNLLKIQGSSDSISEILQNNSLDKSQSSFSVVSNEKAFSIRDIFPEDYSVIEPKHQRMSSQQIDVLSPQVLFSHLRRPSASTLPMKKHTILHGENEEANITRVPTSHSRRVSSYDIGNIQPIPQKESFSFIDHQQHENKENLNRIDQNLYRNSPQYTKNPRKTIEKQSVWHNFMSYFCGCFHPNVVSDIKF